MTDQRERFQRLSTAASDPAVRSDPDRRSALLRDLTAFLKDVHTDACALRPVHQVPRVDAPVPASNDADAEWSDVARWTAEDFAELILNQGSTPASPRLAALAAALSRADFEGRLAAIAASSAILHRAGELGRLLLQLPLTDGALMGDLHQLIVLDRSARVRIQQADQGEP